MIERGTFDTKETIRRDSNQKFADMKVSIDDKHKEKTEKLTKNKDT